MQRGDHPHQLLQYSIVIILWVLSNQSNGEIHRAKSTPYKSIDQTQSTLQWRDFEADTDSKVEQPKMHQGDIDDLLTVGTNDDGGFRAYKFETDISTPRQIYEIWIFSLTGAILVGLSGIFPLLVIPLESGPSLKHGAPAKKLRLMLSFAVGSLLGDVFLHLLPEVWAHIDRDSHASHTRIGLFVISGLLAFMIIEKLMGDENEFEHLPDTCDEAEGSEKNEKQRDSEVKCTKKEAHRDTNSLNLSLNSNKQSNNGKLPKHKRAKKRDILHDDSTGNTAKLKQLTERENCEKKVPSNKNHSENSSDISAEVTQTNGKGIKVSGYLNLMANVVDNFTHGLAVAGSFCISNKVGLVTTLAILLHEIPHEVGDFAILLRSGFSRWKAAKAQFLTATGGVVGAVTALTAESAEIAGERTAWILPFTSGGFIYIALVTVVPDLLQEKHGWESVKQVCCICLGVLSMVAVTLAFD